jgi:hypothetical protein
LDIATKRRLARFAVEHEFPLSKLPGKRTAATDVDWTVAFYGSVLAANTGLRGGEIKLFRIA